MRQAILDANGDGENSSITFNIGMGGAQTIAPASALPVALGAVTIDGTTQPGFAGTPLITLDGTNAGPTANGLVIDHTGGFGTYSRVKGLIIINFSESGLELRGPGGSGLGAVMVQGCYIGIDVNSEKKANKTGIKVLGWNNLIGDITGPVTAAARNVISGNTEHGIYVTSTGRSTYVFANYIGTDRFGENPKGNGGSGVFVQSTAYVQIGLEVAVDQNGVIVDAANVISGNGEHGVHLSGQYSPGTADHVIIGNFIGTHRNGVQIVGNDPTQSMGNGGFGVYVEGSPDNHIGGTTAGKRNVISGNQQGGIRIGGSLSTNNQLINNKIGRDKSNTKPPQPVIDLGNKRYGVLVEDLSQNTKIKPNNEILYTKAVGGVGGRGIVSRTGANRTEKADPNIIAFNDDLGIDLGDDGPTGNDPTDPDLGPDDLQNFPVLTSAVVNSGFITIQGTLNSTPSSIGQPPRYFLIELFGNAMCDSSGYGEGEQFIGGTQVTTDQYGNASFQITTGFTPGSYTVVTSTATDLLTRNTSEFSACIGVVIQSYAYNPPTYGTKSTVSQAISAIGAALLSQQSQPGTPISVPRRTDSHVWTSRPEASDRPRLWDAPGIATEERRRFLNATDQFFSQLVDEDGGPFARADVWGIL